MKIPEQSNPETLNTETKQRQRQQRQPPDNSQTDPMHEITQPQPTNPIQIPKPCFHNLLLSRARIMKTLIQTVQGPAKTLALAAHSKPKPLNPTAPPQTLNPKP